jgi:hypothetical protein
MQRRQLRHLRGEHAVHANGGTLSCGVALLHQRHANLRGPADQPPEWNGLRHESCLQRRELSDLRGGKPLHPEWERLPDRDDRL